MHEPRDSDQAGDECPEEEIVERERWELLRRLEDWLETPMLVLAFVWLALLVLELTRGDSRAFFLIGSVIWGVFILDFALKILLAPRKLVYLRRNWLTAISLLIPALRVFRIFRALRILRLARAGRGLHLVRVVSSLNRGMKALGNSLSRRGFGYVVVLTLLVTFAGAAGMYAFEGGVEGGPDSYGAALWWTAMLLTTLGSQYWPVTMEGRILCLFLALYALGVFGYVTAALASFFVGRDADDDEAEVAGGRQLAELRAEVRALREDIRSLSRLPQLP